MFFRKIRPDAVNNPTWHEVATRGANTFLGDQIFSGNRVTFSGYLVLKGAQTIINETDNENIVMRGGTHGCQVVLRGANDSSNSNGFEIYNGSKHTLTIDKNSHVTIDGSLGVTGEVTASNIAGSSDIRFKKNIKPLNNSLEKISLLEGITYNWKTDEYPDKNFEDSKQIGLIAQEVEMIIPELVHTDNEGYKSIRYNKLTPVLIEAVKELKTKNDCLQQQINNQQKEIDELKSLVNQYIRNI